MEDFDFDLSRPCIQKIDWAYTHLLELKTLVEKYRATHPYTVSRHVEGKGKRQRVVWRLHITEPPPRQIALTVGDFLYSTRASLEYLASDLVAPSERTRSSFPILDERIWEIPRVEGENKQRAATRARWDSVERTWPADAVAIVKELHPPSGQPKRGEAAHALRLLNTLANKDRHRNLTIVASGLALEGAEFTVTFATGEVETTSADGDTFRRALKDGTEIIQLPEGVVNVEVRGSVEVVMHVSPEWHHMVVADDLDTLWTKTAEALMALLPHVRS